MKSLRCGLALLFLHTLLLAQTPAAAPAADTTIYQPFDLTALPYPFLRSCQPERHSGWTADSVRRCAEYGLQALLAQNINYPEAARRAGTEGSVVLSFVVEPAGRLSRLTIMKDIGNGCGAEALRVMRALDSLGLRWQPGLKERIPVRTQLVLPLRFRLQETLPYYLNEDGDSVYVTVDSMPVFAGGQATLEKFVLNRLEYPAGALDSCKTGVIEMALLVYPDGAIEVGNQLDYNNLGLDFQWQAVRLAGRTTGLWQPATFQGKPVTTTYPLRVVFKSPQPGCATANARFDRAMLLADEGAQLADQGQNEAAVSKWNEALKLQPNNTELLYYRGTSLLNLNKRTEACADFNRVKAILGVTWFEEVRRLVCGW